MNPSDKSAFKKKQEFQLRKIRGIYIIKSGVCELDTLNNWVKLIIWNGLLIQSLILGWL